MSINKIYKITSLSVSLIFFMCSLHAQEKYSIEKRIGTITFISSRHYYVQFENTELINVGDSLYVLKDSKLIPALIVKFISSRSCAGEKVFKNDLKINDQILAVVRRKITEQVSAKSESEIKTETSKMNAPAVQKSAGIGKRYTYGRFSAQTFSNLTNTEYSDKSLRWRYSFQFTSDSIGSGPISFSTYMFFSYNSTDWVRVKLNLGSALKIYDMFFSYKFNNNSMLWLGRHLNYKISSIGSIDGFQYEKTAGKFFYGGIIGSHPDFSDYGFNFKMFEFGAYAGRVDTLNNSTMENTVAFFNQTNNFKTDRRYLYFQHSNNLINNINFFVSSEFDLYKNIMGTEKNDLSLTSLFASLFYNPSHLLSFSLSYDARRNVMYYETYKTFIDSLFQNEMMHGYRANIYLRPFNNFSLSINGGYRNRTGDSKPSLNYGASIYYSDLPILNVNTSLSFTKLESSYTNGLWGDLRFDKYIDALNMNCSLGYRYLEYKLYSGDKLIQNVVAGDISFLLPMDFYLSLNLETTFEKQNTYQRFFIDLTKRF